MKHCLPVTCLWLWLESDRMRSLKVTQENLDNQRNAVQEEKRLRYDNQPYVNAFLRINELIFKNPANAHSTIGSMEDLDAATIEDVQEFFRIYYAPNNAVLTIVGDFEVQEATALVNKYFEGIPSQPPPPPVDISEPEDVARTSGGLFTTSSLPRLLLCLAGRFRRAAHPTSTRFRRCGSYFRRRQFPALPKAGEG